MRAHIEQLLVGSVGPAMAIRAAIGLGDRLHEFVHAAFKDSLAALLRRREFPGSESPAIGAGVEAANVGGEIGKRQVVVILRTPEVFFRTRSALRGYVGICARPLVGCCVLDAFDQFVVDGVASETVGFEVPG